MRLGREHQRPAREPRSGNPHDDGYLKNREASDNYGADLHHVTHTNANQGCGDSAQYVLAMFKSDNTQSQALASELLANLDPVVPGHQNSWNCDNLAECGVQAPNVAYLELFFHTNQTAADWFMASDGDHGNGCQDGQCGWAQSGQAVATTIDTFLGQPRPASPGASYPLNPYPGFGRTPQAMLRDDTIAYWEAYQRELVVQACMQEAGFDHTPAVAYPTEAMLRVASNLPAGDIDHGGPAHGRPDELNRAHEHSLTPTEQDRYNRTLYDETAADIAAANHEGAAPHGRGTDFATGGCSGRADTADPSIWDTRRATIRPLIASWNGPAQQATTAAREVIADHGAELATLDARYEGVMERITQDIAFLTYLAHQVQLAGAS